MKKFSQLIEESALTQLAQKTDNGAGTTNKYTPINNIITNVKNFFGATYNIVVTEGPGNSVELRCSRWINVDEAYKDLNGIEVARKTITSYISEQGLDSMKLIQEGQRILAVFYASDIKDDATKTFNKLPDASEYTDSHANENRNFQTCLIYTDSYANESFEYEILDQKTIGEGKEDDDEMEDTTQKELRELIVTDNKVKSAEKFAELVAQTIDLPSEYYWKAVKDKDGNESIALRHKTEKRRPFGKKAEIIDSVINIYGTGEEAIWVDGYDDIDNMPDDMKRLIENILQLLGAEKTPDICVYSLKETDDDDDEEDKPKATIGAGLADDSSEDDDEDDI
ncbi:MAG: hypothetical protein J1F35_03620 [Erysipelotrichales bacterium]|nr:hypothetical protein [Erysipelotrichales bacterium]